MGTGMRVNVLVNYGWEWDLRTAAQGDPKRRFHERLASADVSRIDLLVRWGGMRRLSGMLPVQTVYSDFYVVEDLWPDYEAEQFFTPSIVIGAIAGVKDSLAAKPPVNYDRVLPNPPFGKSPASRLSIRMATK
jgi:hypothetical protein